jgi:hypothetical protein
LDLLDKHICLCKKCKIGSTETYPTGYGKETVFRLVNLNKKKVDKYIVDDCLLKRLTKNEKCDYLFQIDIDKIIYLIECKGSDILKAINQIESTLKILKDSIHENKIKGRIVSTKVYSPDIRTQSYLRLREKLDGDLLIKNKNNEENI